MQLTKQGQFILSFVPEKEILFGKSGLLGKGAGILPVQYPEVTGMFFPMVCTPLKANKWFISCDSR